MAKKKPFILKKKQQRPGLFEKINCWFDENYSGLMVFLTVVMFIFSMLLFNARISEGGDDSTYIEAGYNYSRDFFNYHFTYNAPLYPMGLSIPIKIFGINIRVLKFTSIVFSVLHLIFLFLAFRKRIPNLILYPVLFIVSINSYFLYYASQTYNEAFFLFIQAFFFIAAFNLIDNVESHTRVSETYKHWLFFGFAAFLLAMSKNVALIGVLAIVFYFFVNRQFRNAIYSVGFFLLFRIPYEVFNYFVWTKDMQYKSQFSTQMLKDAYHPEQGNENVAGFISRFFGNADLYFSRRLMHILNFKPESDVILNHYETIAVTIFILLGFFALLKAKNKYLLISFFYAIPMIAATFLLLQVSWDQPRLILIFVPFMLFISIFGMYYFAHKWNKPILQILFIAVVVCLTFLSIIPTLKKTKENLAVLRQNLHGDLYFGYTPDWSNFLKMSEWCGSNLPDTAYIASRKPSMSFIYSGGKKFYPVYNVSTANADSVLMQLYDNRVTHALIASLRKDKSKPADSSNVINTVHRFLKPVAEKYPQTLKLAHKIGEAETAYLIELQYTDSFKNAMAKRGTVKINQGISGSVEQ